MKTLALDHLPASIQRSDSRFITTIKNRFYENLERIEYGRIVFVDGDKVHGCGTGMESHATIVVNDDRFYTSMAFGGALGAAEAYMQGCWTCEHLTELIRILLRNRHVLVGLDQNSIKKALFKVLHWFNRDTEQGARKNIAAHYDLGNDLFKLFLDPTLSYSSGIFDTPDSSMEEASIAKMDLICKKMDLNESDHIIEIGTGWGSFAIHAAASYGCHVTTTTISENQYDTARSRIAEAGLSDKIKLLKKDYRQLEGQFDKLVSIEMIEAVGLSYLSSYFAKCADLLKPTGSMLIQAITIADQHFEFSKRNVDFIQRYIFPGGALPSVTALTTTATSYSNLRLYALEDITSHYAQTLQKWREKFYNNIDAITRLGYDNRFLRMWEYYLCYCEGGFKERTIGCIHAEFHKPLYRPRIAL